MLMMSERHTKADRQAWEKLEVWDAMLADSGRIDDLADASMHVIREFVKTETAFVSTSWGKDSTVLVDLVGRSGVDVPVVQLVIDGYEMPGTTEVRDQMIVRYPHLQYEELVLPPQPNRWWDSVTTPQSKYRADMGWRLIEERFGSRRMTGIRAEESRMRHMVQAKWGDQSPNTARPIGWWEATDVFAYLYKYDLPVHPAYAMSSGGRRDRRWLRVHALGGVTGADRGRAEWETQYFGDVIQRSRCRDAIMAALPTSKRDSVLGATLAAHAGYPIQEVGPILAHTPGIQRVDYMHATRWWRSVEWPPRPRWHSLKDE